MKEEYDKIKKERDELKKEKDKIQRERDRKINNMEFEYKAKLRKLEEKLKKKVKSSDIREVGEFLSRDEDGIEIDNEEKLKKLKAEKKKFKDLSRDKNVPLEQRLFYNKISKLLDYKIDLANIATGRPIETARGQKLKKERDKVRKGFLGLLFRAAHNSVAGAFALSAFLGLGWYLYQIINEAANGAAKMANNNSKPSPDVNIKFKKDGKKGITDKSKPITDVATVDKEQTKHGTTKYIDWDKIYDSIHDSTAKGVTAGLNALG